MFYRTCSEFHAHQRDDSEGALHREAQDERQAFEGGAGADQAATSLAYAPPGGANGRVAQVCRARLLQLPRGTGKSRSSGGLSGKGDSTLAADAPKSQPEAPAPLALDSPLGGSMASPTARAPSLILGFALPLAISDKSRMRYSAHVRIGAGGTR